MKATVYLTLAFLTFFMFGCSREQLDEPIQQVIEVENNALKEEVKHFSFKSEYLFEIRTSSECGLLDHLEINGSGTSTLMGEFKLQARRCTDFRKENYIKGRHIDKNGHQLFFYSDEFRIDSKGFYSTYVFYNGTGPYEGFSKTVKVYIQDEIMEDNKGRSFSEGTAE